MQSKAKTVKEYLAELPADRRAALEALRKVFLANLDQGFEEGMGYGMMGYYVPHSIYPAGYHCDPKQPLPYAGMASQKNYMSLYLMGCYMSPESVKWLRTEWAKTGKKLDMGKSCIRFKKLEDLPLDLVGKAIKRMPLKEYIRLYEAALPPKTKAARKAKPKAAARKAKSGPASKARKARR